MLYLIKSGNYIKVGYSKNVDKRMCCYNTCNPDYLLLDAVEGTTKDESEFHKLISSYHYKLEWFLYNENIIDIWNTKYNRCVKCPKLEHISKRAKELFIWLCNHTKFDTTQVLLSTGIRKELSEELNMSQSCITTNLKALKDLNLISGERGVFTINPQVFWKGDEKARKAFMNEQEIKIKFSI